MPRTKSRACCRPSAEPQPAPTDAPPDQSQPPVAKTCTICRIAKPIGEFRRRSKGGEVKHSYCNGCRRAYEADRRFAKQHGQLGRFNAQLAKHRLDSRAVVQFCHKAFDYFGGLDRFAQLWIRHLTLAMQQAPGRKYVLDAFGAVLALTRVVEEFRKQHRPNLDTMSDTELHEHVRGLLESGMPEGPQGVEGDADA